VLRERGLSPNEMFDVIVQSVVNAFETAVQERQSRWLPAGTVEGTA